jgi:hypothetical protein
MAERDWQIVVIGNTFVDEVDCNSGERRRVYHSGDVKKIS